jgi:site-specific DNA-methyltransferase (adenine-specific)
MIQGETYTVHIGNNLDILPTLADNSVDSIVTDPPYELGFMGKKWDSSGIAYSVELWRECLRVLKPGGHLLAFSGSRTYHRMVVAIEDAGFEVRDMISWISNKTFPKSLDVSKAIDKGTGQTKERQLKFTAWMRSTGITAEQINAATETSMASHYLTDKTQPAIATADLFDKLRPYLPEVPEEIERLVAERTGIEWKAYKNRKVVGQRQVPKGHSFASEKFGKETGNKEINETKSATSEAKQWEGWGTGLKPSVEPIVMARKPLIGTVAANVLEHGTGALNIDGTRIGKEKRWPSNCLLDRSAEEALAENARFFFVAKAKGKDRNEGLKSENQHPTVKPTQLMRYLVKLVTPPGGTVLDPFTGSGSTGKAAILEGFRFIGCELTEDYIPIIEGRLKHAELMKAELEAKEEEALF